MLEAKSVTGLEWNENHFTTVVPFKWIVDNLISGLVLEQAERDLAQGLSVDSRAAQLASMRGKMQRPFEDVVRTKKSIRGESVEIDQLRPTAKLVNTRGSLRDYLLEQFAVSPEEAFGVLPGFVAVWPELMDPRSIDVELPGMVSRWQIFDYGHLGRGALADGECRHLAGIEINADPKVSPALKDKLMHQPVTVEVFHGISEAKAAQMFIDLNFEGTPVAGITKANLDPRNKWITVTKGIFEDLGIGLAITGRQLTDSHKRQSQWLLITHAEQMVKAIALGPTKALTKSKKTQSWEGVDFERLHKAGVEWFGEIFDFFGGPEVLGDQSRVIRSIPVRVALASLGTAHYQHRLEDKAAASRTLKEVNWIVSERWNGIGGKVTINDQGVAKMAAGSGKETITRAVQAVTKRDTRAGRYVRGLPEPGEEQPPN